MTNATVWRCRICGDSYLGSDCPTNCPFCGSRKEYIVLTTAFPPNINDVQITDAERADLEYACELEITNETFYSAVGVMGNHNNLLPSAFRALAKVEREHLSIFGKLLKTPVPTEPTNPIEVQDAWTANIAQSKKDEEVASTFYREAAQRATTPRVKEVFTALAEVEEDHIDIDNYLATIAEQ